MFEDNENNDGNLNFWPGFIDVLSSVLMVIIFVLMGFFISQIYLSNALSTKNTSLTDLEVEYKNLKIKNKNLNSGISKLKFDILELQKRLNIKISEVTSLSDNKNKIENEKDSLLKKLSELNELLKTEKELNYSKEIIAQKNYTDEIQIKMDEIRKLTQELKNLKKQIPEYVLQNPELLQYRSEFFGSLQKIIGVRDDIKIIGDRFLFQSEILFEVGAAELGKNGKKHLDSIAKIICEISKKIPKNIPWIIRIDGHTDNIPIHNEYFDSNWELSVARAISVVKYLIKNGVNPKNLVAAGFGENCPINEMSDNNKNRRIELRFDQK